jgi:maltooligosyltrehalose trehalohydrolase
MHGAVLGTTAFLLRFITDDDNDRLLLVNLGCDLPFHPAPEPLLAPPENARWQVLWSSEDPRYGGHGTPPLAIESDDDWRVPGHAAVVLYPVRRCWRERGAPWMTWSSTPVPCR